MEGSKVTVTETNMIGMHYLLLKTIKAFILITSFLSLNIILKCKSFLVISNFK